VTGRERKTFEKYLRGILGELNRRKVKGSGRPGLDLQDVATADLLALALKCSEALRPEKEVRVKAALIEPESKKALYGLSGLARFEDRGGSPEKGG